MDTKALQALGSDWPHDNIKVDSSGLSDLGAMAFGPRGESIYEHSLQVDQADSQHIAEFAKDNGWTYQQRTDEFRQTKFAGRLPAWLGRQFKTTQPVFAHVVSGEVYGFPVKMFVGYSAAAAQTNNNDIIRLTRKSYIKVSLPEVFPQMVLDSNKNDRGFAASMPTSFKTNQKLQLEGDFPKYFDFYSPVGLQVNTLTVLAPNFMQIIKDSAHSFDVEFFGKEMILVTHDPIYSPEMMKVALEALHAQLKYLERLLPSWNYQPVNQPFDLLKTTLFEGQPYKIGRLRISPAQFLMLILAGFIISALMMQFLGIFGYLFFALVFLIIIYLTYRGNKT